MLTMEGCLGTPTQQSTAGAGKSGSSQPGETASKARKPRRRSESGKFDFYVMALSWSPGFCATPAGRNDDTQCGPQRHFAFVLHGLWPQYEDRGWPRDCSTDRLDTSVVEGMLPIMPSPRLIRHEWSKHGTCSGLSSKEYFEEAAEAFGSVKIPDAYRAPLKQINVDPQTIQREFAAANPGFPAGAFAVICTNNGRFLQEVRACLTKDLAGRPCNREVARSACKSNSVIMRPVR
jgi:ribonuclease T2